MDGSGTSRWAPSTSSAYTTSGLWGATVKSILSLPLSSSSSAGGALGSAPGAARSLLMMLPARTVAAAPRAAQLYAGIHALPPRNTNSCSGVPGDALLTHRADAAAAAGSSADVRRSRLHALPYASARLAERPARSTMQPPIMLMQGAAAIGGMGTEEISACLQGGSCTHDLHACMIQNSETDWMH